MEWVEKTKKSDKKIGEGVLIIEASNALLAEENSKYPGYDSNSNSFRKHLQDLAEANEEISKCLAKGKLLYTTGKAKEITKNKWEVPFKTFHRPDLIKSHPSRIEGRPDLPHATS